MWFPVEDQQDLLVYANREKINRWNKSSGPKSLRGSNDSDTSVLTEKDLVKEKFKYVTPLRLCHVAHSEFVRYDKFSVA